MCNGHHAPSTSFCEIQEHDRGAIHEAQDKHRSTNIAHVDVTLWQAAYPHKILSLKEGVLWTLLPGFQGNSEIVASV